MGCTSAGRGAAEIAAGLHAAKAKMKTGPNWAMDLRASFSSRMCPSCFMELIWFLLFKGYDGYSRRFVPYDLSTFWMSDPSASLEPS